jgi:hypothetical protein
MDENPPIPTSELDSVDQQSTPTTPPSLTPEVVPIASAPETPPVVLTAEAQRHLTKTGPWVRFLSIMMFIGAGFLMLAGISLALVALAGMQSPMSPVTTGSLPNGAAFLLGPIYVIVALLTYIVPGLFLFRYASAIKVLKLNPSSLSLEDAIKQQKTFWRYLGILAIILLCVFVLIMMAAMFFAIILSMRS